MGSNRNTVGHNSPAPLPDVGLATLIPTAFAVPPEHPEQRLPNQFTGSDSDVPKVSPRRGSLGGAFQHWSPQKLTQALESVAQVHTPLSHLECVAQQNTPQTTEPTRTLNHIQCTRRILHQQCNVICYKG